MYIGKTGEKEIDFVAENKEGFTYFQVAYTTREISIYAKIVKNITSINIGV